MKNSLAPLITVGCPVNDDDHAWERVCIAAAALLDQGRVLDALSRLLTASALVGLVVLPLLAARRPPIGLAPTKRVLIWRSF